MARKRRRQKRGIIRVANEKRSQRSSTIYNFNIEEDIPPSRRKSMMSNRKETEEASQLSQSPPGKEVKKDYISSGETGDMRVEEIVDNDNAPSTSSFGSSSFSVSTAKLDFDPLTGAWIDRRLLTNPLGNDEKNEDPLGNRICGWTMVSSEEDEENGRGYSSSSASYQGRVTLWGEKDRRHSPDPRERAPCSSFPLERMYDAVCQTSEMSEGEVEIRWRRSRPLARALHHARRSDKVVKKYHTCVGCEENVRFGRLLCESCLQDEICAHSDARKELERLEHVSASTEMREGKHRKDLNATSCLSQKSSSKRKQLSNRCSSASVEKSKKKSSDEQFIDMKTKKEVNNSNSTKTSSSYSEHSVSATTDQSCSSYSSYWILPKKKTSRRRMSASAKSSHSSHSLLYLSSLNHYSSTRRQQRTTYSLGRKYRHLYREKAYTSNQDDGDETDLNDRKEKTSVYRAFARTFCLLLKPFASSYKTDDMSSVQQLAHNAAHCYIQLTSGYHLSTSQLTKLIRPTTTLRLHSDLLIERQLPFLSLCNKHVLPFRGLCSVGYIPSSRGLLAQADLEAVLSAVSHRLQSPKSLAEALATIIQRRLEPRGVVVVIRAKLICETMMPVDSKETDTITTATRGTLQLGGGGPWREFFSLEGLGV